MLVEAISSSELQANPSHYCLIDIREQEEWDADHLPEAHHIPLSKLAHEGSKVLPDSKDKPYLLYCQTGIRSDLACRLLLAEGEIQPKVAHLEGGITTYREFESE